jgi:hypothetical protein
MVVAKIHVLANSHLKQGIWALNPGEDRCSISRTVLIGTISIVRSDVTIFFPLKFSQLRPIFDLRLFVKPATESSKDDKLYSTPIVISFDYFFIYGIV